ncbi:MAG: XRE family transcriptional regulator [Gemmatimonadetes bacterium]|nr:MAG: XRE family transcriptional regulator [Gemmatimonadota bacterium]
MNHDDATFLTREELGALIRKVRGKATREEFVKHFNGEYSPSNLESYENGRAFPPIRFLMLMCNTFGISLDYLLFRKQIHPPPFDQALSEPELYVLEVARKFPELVGVLSKYEEIQSTRSLRELTRRLFGELNESKIFKLALLVGGDQRPMNEA